MAALQQGLEFFLQREEVADPCADVSESGVQERGDVLAGGGPLVTQVQDAADLGQREPGGLRHGDEAQPCGCGLVIDAVAVGGAFRFGKDCAMKASCVGKQRLPFWVR